MSGYPLTPTQRLWNLLREAADEAASNMRKCSGVIDGVAADDFERFNFERGRQAAFLRALEMLKELDADADPGERVSDRVY